MNRVIKFRGRRKGGTEWLCGDLNHINGQVFIMPREEDTPLNSPDWFEVYPDTVGQFTGITDKNGVDIYEGDIIRLSAGHPNKIRLNYLVIFEMGAFQLKTPSEELPVAFFTYASQCMANDVIYDQTHISRYMEIIGNIHQNPELLGKK